MIIRSACTCFIIKYMYTYIVFIYWTNQFEEKNKNYMAYFCHHLSDNYVDLSDLYDVDLLDNYVESSQLVAKYLIMPLTAIYTCQFNI